MTPLLWSLALLHQLKHQAIHLTPPPPRPPLCTTITPALGSHTYRFLGKDFHSDCRMLSQEGTELIQRTGEETSTRMSLEAESNLPIAPRLIMLGQSSMTATCWMVSAEGRVIVELDKENTFADAMSVFFGSFYVLNLEYQESACATLELIQRFFVRINPEEGTKCTSKVGTSRKTGTAVK
ncbi:uncharacterized protein LOC112847940 isoform X2 [Oreochromis niloticus]|uniref:uncharacterized protein LOC112847940 isoform X2 n=1 Tax=Oreochromis niloticus TaxID=8128 RepID=UPI000DF39237|nr:uncharacterized protein LOC112847940 isoform X2 [Oreochromis niloticus]XP_025766363.1 uncharacterized protein LOC112847940 isoform X2 [Oreochromis niloticus]XP_025766364.1 uncharacterized protein LOC112847940 isoform X2 [Oreochromis niloticus]